MSTDIDIVNSALQKLGQSPITEFGQNIGTGLIAKSEYESSRDYLLRKTPWNFARKWATLAMLSSFPISLDIGPNSAGPGAIRFTAAYQLPIDCLRVYRFSPRDAHWRIIGRAIYTDATAALNVGPLIGLQPLGSDGADNQPPTPVNIPLNDLGIEYIYRVTDPALFDPMFEDAFVWHLAKEMAFGVTGLENLFKMAEEQFQEHFADASAVNGMEQWPDEFYNTDLNDVRYGYSGLSFGGF